MTEKSLWINDSDKDREEQENVMNKDISLMAKAIWLDYVLM